MSAPLLKFFVQEISVERGGVVLREGTEEEDVSGWSFLSRFILVTAVSLRLLFLDPAVPVLLCLACVFMIATLSRA